MSCCYDIKLETLRRELIKPSTPTPPNFKIFKLSLLDQLSPNIHGNTTHFYLNTNTSHNYSHFSFKSHLLQNSLSQTLTLFYPLAGRLHDASTIDCNDEGAFFIESRTETTLSHILTNPDFDTLQCFLPTTDKEAMSMSNVPMLLVRFTLFGCGSTALTVSLTHKIVDFSTVITFLKAWTAVCRGGGIPAPPELTTGAALFPPREIPGMSGSVNYTSNEKFTSRRFVFNAYKVAELKNKVKSALELEHEGDEGGLFHPSRVEVVLALIWRCALSAASRSKTASFKASALFQAVNLRSRMEPPIPETAVGNMVWPVAVTVEEGNHVALHEMVKRMRYAMREFIDNKANRLKEEGGFGVVMESVKERGELWKKNEEIVVYKCSSWCKFPVMEFDFGWGKPIWICSVNKMVSNTIALMDTSDGGIEAFVTLDESDMAFFEQDHDLLHYALLNPTIMI